MKIADPCCQIRSSHSSTPLAPIVPPAGVPGPVGPPGVANAAPLPGTPLRSHFNTDYFGKPDEDPATHLLRKMIG